MSNKFKRVPISVPVTELTPLNITCTSTKCEDNLHCFKQSKTSIKKHGKTGVCKECAADLIDWKRMSHNDIKDANFIFQSMRNELIRHVYWHTDLGHDTVSKAIKRGTSEIRSRTYKLLKDKIGKANNFREGYQTPNKGNEVINYAQHATATCCRKCLEYWHNIPIGRELTEPELAFCTDLILLYVEERVPNIKEHGIEDIE